MCTLTGLLITQISRPVSSIWTDDDASGRRYYLENAQEYLTKYSGFFFHDVAGMYSCVCAFVCWGVYVSVCRPVGVSSGMLLLGVLRGHVCVSVYGPVCASIYVCVRPVLCSHRHLDRRKPHSVRSFGERDRRLRLVNSKWCPRYVSFVRTWVGNS